jgi:uncharacterized membrane protein
MEIIRHKYQAQNVGTVERAASLAAGALLLGSGIRNKGWTGAASALAGIAFLHRAITGFSYTYQALGINSMCPGAKRIARQGSNVSVPHRTGIRIDEAVTIDKPRAEVFRFWRDLANIAHFMRHVESVQTIGNGGGARSHWIAKGPGGTTFEWDAEIINEKENERIAWRSLEGSAVANAGSVHFNDAAGGRGTEVHVEILYTPPGGAVGSLIAKLFGEDPACQIRSDLKRLKAWLEAGVLPETEGQSAGPKSAKRQNTGQKKRQRQNDEVTKASEESFPASDAPAFTR